MPATLGLSTYRWNNNIKSVLLLTLFPFLLLALLGAIFLLFSLVYMDPATGIVNPAMLGNFGLGDISCAGHLDTNYMPLKACRPWEVGAGAIYNYWPIVTGIAVIWVTIGYFFNDAIIHLATGAQPVSRTDQPKLYNILENLCISRGLTMPRLYIIDTDEMNAYASGIDQRSYAITVTSGLLAKLSDQELEAVLAHELTHIIDRDCRLLIVTIVFTGMISFVAQLLWRSLRIATYGRSGRDKGGGAVLVLMLIAAVALGIGYFLALILRFAISRKREYLADAGSVEITKNPEALISALKKISCACDVPHVPSEVRQMFIENPPSVFDMGGLFATHPAIADRIKVLEELGGLPPEGHSVIPQTTA